MERLDTITRRVLADLRDRMERKAPEAFDGLRGECAPAGGGEKPTRFGEGAGGPCLASPSKGARRRGRPTAQQQTTGRLE